MEVQLLSTLYYVDGYSVKTKLIRKTIYSLSPIFVVSMATAYSLQLLCIFKTHTLIKAPSQFNKSFSTRIFSSTNFTEGDIDMD